jgi:hypothetical protein
MKVKVEFSATRDLDGLKSVVTEWETKYPQAQLSGVSAWGSQIDVQLQMPEATQVMLPQITDARGIVEEG